MNDPDNKKGDNFIKNTVNNLGELLEQLKIAIWQKRPILGEIMGKHGNKTLHEYAKDFLDVNKSPLLDKRKYELINAVRELLSVRLGDKVAEGVASQLGKKALVSTIDHQAIIDHPFFVNANIISSIPFFENSYFNNRYQVVFSFASVSLNNASAYPRGLEFHAHKEAKGEFIRLPVFADKYKMSTVYSAPALQKQDWEKAILDLQKRATKNEIEKTVAEEIIKIIEEYFMKEEVLSLTDYTSQITRINYLLWPKFFHTAAPLKKTSKVPDLIYLDIESLVTNLLLKKHLINSKSLIHHLLFNRHYQELAKQFFNNLEGAFDWENKTGTYFFWLVDEKLRRVGLFLENGFLQTKDGETKIPFTPEAIKDALERKKIFPSMLLCYLLISLYYGMKCLGGFCQVHDLTMVKIKWGEMLKALKLEEEYLAIQPVQTKELGGDGMVLAYLKNQHGVAPATGWDLLVSDQDTTYETYFSLAGKVVLLEVMNPLLKEMYTVLYPSYERDNKLAEVDPLLVIKELGLEAKISQHL